MGPNSLLVVYVDPLGRRTVEGSGFGVVPLRVAKQDGHNPKP